MVSYENFGKIFHLTTSETSTPWPSIYKPGGITTITTTDLSLRITSSGEDSHYHLQIYR